MKTRIILICIAVILLMFCRANVLLYADCRGCCSGHGGIVCDNGITKCVDGTDLTQSCKNKGCDVCGTTTTPTTNTSSNKTIKIASFNIQIFGRAKAKKPEVMEILARTISNFDIVAIQEIRDKTATAIKKLEVDVDELGTNYDYIMGPRLGRTNSKEQYAFFYNTETITASGSYTYIENSGDIFHREPFIGKFQAKNGIFDFIIINIHADPDEATSEIKSLPLVVNDAKSHFSENDVIVLGDLNADCSYYNEDSSHTLTGSDYKWLISNDMVTNMANTPCTYDRIIITSTLREDYADVANVFRFDQEFELDCERREVSDHYPVFASFHIDRDTD